MATNKKITQLDELTPATWADDDVIAIVDISAQETKKIQLSTFRGAVTGVSSLNASTPLTVDSATGDVTISVAIDGGGTINAVFDEDDMTSNSPTALATQQSIKAYVDSQVGTVDTLAEILSNGNTSGGTNIVVSAGDVITTNTINETTAAAGVTIDGVLMKDGEVDGRDVSVDGTKLDTIETNADVTDTANVTAAGALMDSELTDIAAVKALDQGVATTDSPSFAGLTATTADINGGTIDGTVIGGSSPAAISGTTGSFSGNLTVDTNTLFVNAANNRVGIGTTAPASALTVSDGTASGLTPFSGTELFLDSSGDNYLQFGSGTSSSPAIYFGDSADGDVGGIIYAHASNAMSFRTNAAERMRISSSGNVGIGTAAPAFPLDVQCDTSAFGLQLRGRSADNISVLRFRNNAADTTYFQLDIRATSSNLNTVANAPLFFSTNNTERMRIDSTGNVGIGIASPATKFHVLDGTSSLRFRQNGTVAETLTVGPSGGEAAIYLGDVADTVRAGLFYDTSENALQIRGYNNSTRILIDSSGNVGIGTTSPSKTLDVDGQLRIRDGGATGYALLEYGASATATNNWHVGSEGDGTYRFYNGNRGAGTERMRITSSGNVGIGTSSPSTKTEISTSNETSILRLTDTATIGTVNRKVGGLEFYQNDASGGAGIGSSIEAYHVNISGDTDLRFATGDNTERMRIDSSGVVRPGADNTQTLGSASYRWSVVYAGTGTINTSDEREKQQIADLNDAERRVAVALKGLVKKYKYNDAVELKGDDARIHVGVIAQEVVAAFEAEGLDATCYALLCYDTWEAEPEETDDEGNVTKPARDAGERYGIRYDELLAFMIAAL